ncbi:hypothetical protein N7490_003748 [Penicillium lividum]|nr:hypothetical protein N7490_003748 [Penicillium lividum]
MDRSLDEIIGEDTVRRHLASIASHFPEDLNDLHIYSAIKTVLPVDDATKAQAAVVATAMALERYCLLGPDPKPSMSDVATDKICANLIRITCSDWVHDKYDDDKDTRPRRGGRSRRSNSPERGGSTMTKVRVDNLHYDITESDLEDLFGQIGPVTELTLVYDRAGRSEGVAHVTYKYLKDAHTSIKEFDGANAKGHPIRLTLIPGRREQHKSLFDRVERPGRDARSLSPGGGRGEQSDRRRGGRVRRSDVSKPAPENIDRYIPGEHGDRSPAVTVVDEVVVTTGLATSRGMRTEEELDQEMEDYWGGNAGTDNAEKPAGQEEQQTVSAPSSTPAAPAATVNDDDIDMIE